MNRYVKTLVGRMSLRKPQREALEILARVTEIVEPKKDADVVGALKAIQSEYPTVLDFEREFVSLCFALATGVGKTRLMGAFIGYLYKEHGLKNFFVLAPNLTIYNKLIADFTPNTPKYVLKGLEMFALEAPAVITGENYEGQARTLFDEQMVCKISVFNISKLNSEMRGGKTPRIRKLSEYLGESYFEYLSKLPDLVLLMDESHRYRADAGVKALNELKPILGLELTATPYTASGKDPVAFKNVVYSYALGKAIEDGFVKDPAVVTRKDFNPEKVSAEELERLKLEDGIRLHEMTRVELETYARESGKARVKPFVLVVARDTDHASELMEKIKGDDFFGGRYKEKVIQVDSTVKKKETEEEMIRRLLGVEKAEDPTEIVIHVDMLKEGWDVTNLYTIIPLRAANARILIEQTIGRGLRLPYGTRVGVEAVDRLSIVAHDKFQEIVEEARKPGSMIQVKVLELERAELEEKKTTVITPPRLSEILETGVEEKEEVKGAGEISVPKGTEERIAILTKEEIPIAQAAYEVVLEYQRQPGKVPTLGALRESQVQEEIAALVKERRKPEQEELEGIVKKPSEKEVVKKVVEEINEKMISIPRIVLVPKEEQKKGYRWFRLDLKALRLPPVDEALWVQSLQSGEGKELRMEAEGREERLENYVIRGLMDMDEVNYDANAELLQALASQVVEHLQGYLGLPGEVEKVLRVHQREVTKFVYAQMKKHQWKEAIEYEPRVTQGFTELKPIASTMIGEEIVDFRHPLKEKRAIGKLLFGGFTRSLYRTAKFHSDTERKLAVLLDRDSQKWFRPAKGLFSIYYKAPSGEEPEYLPDFVAETEESVLMLETKAVNEIESPEVEEKMRAAVEWCRHASEYSQAHGGKRWRYALIPHNEVRENMSLAGLAKMWGR